MYITNNIPLVSRFFRKILQQTRRWQKRWWGRTQTEQWPPPQRNTCWPPARDLSLFDQCHETANRKTQNIHLFQTKLHDCNWIQEKHGYTLHADKKFMIAATSYHFHIPKFTDITYGGGWTWVLPHSTDRAEELTH